MPASADLTSPLDRQLLSQLGARMKQLRVSKRTSAAALAQTVGISRTTLAAVESGDPSPTMGTYVRVMSALGIAGDLALLASNTLTPPASYEPANAAISVSVAAESPHELQDLQSLMLHKEAVNRLRRDPALIDKALATLEKWRTQPNARSRVLWDKWSVILHRREWRKVLATTRRARELRQASPLPTLLPPVVRDEVLAQVQQLKKGVMLGEIRIAPRRARPRVKA